MISVTISGDAAEVRGFFGMLGQKPEPVSEPGIPVSPEPYKNKRGVLLFPPDWAAAALSLRAVPVCFKMRHILGDRRYTHKEFQAFLLWARTLEGMEVIKVKRSYEFRPFRMENGIRVYAPNAVGWDISPVRAAKLKAVKEFKSREAGEDDIISDAQNNVKRHQKSIRQGRTRFA